MAKATDGLAFSITRHCRIKGYRPCRQHPATWRRRRKIKVCVSQHKQSNGETLMEACKTYFAEELSLLDPEPTQALPGHVVIRDNLIELCGLAQVSGPIGFRRKGVGLPCNDRWGMENQGLILERAPEKGLPRPEKGGTPPKSEPKTVRSQPCLTLPKLQLRNR